MCGGLWWFRGELMVLFWGQRFVTDSGFIFEDSRFGNWVVFGTVPSGFGAKYAAQQFVWWEAGGRGSTFESDFPGPKASPECQEVP